MLEVHLRPVYQVAIYHVLKDLFVCLYIYLNFAYKYIRATANLNLHVFWYKLNFSIFYVIYVEIFILVLYALYKYYFLI